MNEEPTGVRTEHLVIFVSHDGRTMWHPLEAECVPDWVMNPSVLAKLVDGEEAMDCSVEPAGSSWYRAVRVSDLIAMKDESCH